MLSLFELICIAEIILCNFFFVGFLVFVFFRFCLCKSCHASRMLILLRRDSLGGVVMLLYGSYYHRQMTEYYSGSGQGAEARRSISFRFGHSLMFLSCAVEYNLLIVWLTTRIQHSNSCQMDRRVNKASVCWLSCSGCHQADHLRGSPDVTTSWSMEAGHGG